MNLAKDYQNLFGQKGAQADHQTQAQLWLPYARHYKPRLVNFFTPFQKTIYVL